jgi:hypothetical protein
MIRSDAGYGTPAAGPPPAAPLIDLRSTEVPTTVFHEDGTQTTDTTYVVHAPGTTVPAHLHHECSPRCGCRP